MRWAIRELLVGGFATFISEPRPNERLLEELLEAQDPYFQFVARREVPCQSTYEKICRSVSIDVIGSRIRFNLYNTALLSRRPEQQGTLDLPLALIRNTIVADSDAALTIAMFHHPYLWIQSTSTTDFRDHIEKTADIALTGHQHYSHSYTKLVDTGEVLCYLEAPPLQDFHSSSTGFNILLLDLAKQRQKHVQFSWGQQHYTATQEGGWVALVQNDHEASRFVPSEPFLRDLNDAEGPYSHPRKDEIVLQDIFVYPDIFVTKIKNDKSEIEIRGEKVLEYVTNSDHVAFRGRDRSGKTALAKTLFSDLLRTRKFIPLFVDGARLTHAGVDPYQEDSIRRVLADTFVPEYAQGLNERYWQLDKGVRVLILDNWHKSKFNHDGRAAILRSIERLFGKILLFTDTIFPLKELTYNLAESEIQVDFDLVRLAEFGYRKRGLLIDKWLRLGRELTYEPALKQRETESVEALIDNIVSSNKLPSEPMVILCLLQARDGDQPTQPTDFGNFGYLYEVVITTALNDTTRQDSQLAKKYGFLSWFSFWLHDKSRSAATSDEIKILINEYARRQFVSIDADALLHDLYQARVLRSADSNVSFKYALQYQYFLARYFSDRLYGSEGSDIRVRLENMSDRLSSDGYLTVLMFVLFRTMDEGLIARLVEKGDRILMGTPVAEFAGDIDFLNNIQELPEPQKIPEDVNHDEERLKRRETSDKLNPRKTTDESYEDEDEGDSSPYSEELTTAQKVGFALQHLNLLGQVIRNFTGSLEGIHKLEILRCTYQLGLRSVRVIFERVAGSRGSFFEVIKKMQSEEPEHKRQSDAEIQTLIDRVVAFVCRMVALGVINTMSVNLGARDLETAYREALSRVGETDATSLLDLAIRLDHIHGFPMERVKELHRRFRKSAFSELLLRDLVVYYVRRFPMERVTVQQLQSLFNIPGLIRINMGKGTKVSAQVSGS